MLSPPGLVEQRVGSASPFLTSPSASAYADRRTGFAAGLAEVLHGALVIAPALEMHRELGCDLGCVRAVRGLLARADRLGSRMRRLLAMRP